MKIDELRKTDLSHHVYMYGTSTKDILGELLFRVIDEGIEVKAFYTTENTEVINLTLGDYYIEKLRDWLCELYGNPQ